MPVTSTSALFTRIRGLQDSSIVATARAMTTAMTDWTDMGRGLDDVPEGVQAAFVLRIVGWVPDPRSLFSEPLRSQSLQFEEDVSMFCGGGEGTASDFGQRQIDLSNLLEEIVDVIGSSENWDRPTTGIIKIDFGDMSMRNVALKNGRLRGTFAFAVMYERTLS